VLKSLLIVSRKKLYSGRVESRAPSSRNISNGLEVQSRLNRKLRDRRSEFQRDRAWGEVSKM
jgi:hypothetical protein